MTEKWEEGCDHHCGCVFVLREAIRALLQLHDDPVQHGRWNEEPWAAARALIDGSVGG